VGPGERIRLISTATKDRFALPQGLSKPMQTL
jgi:hypothetical protein